MHYSLDKQRSIGLNRDTSKALRPLPSIFKRYQQLLHVGITDDLSFSEKLRVELNNLFLGITIPLAMLHLLYVTFGTSAPPSAYIVSTGWILIMSVPLLLNYRKHYVLARVYSIVIPLAGIATIHLLHGWIVRVEPLYLLIILLSFFFFRQGLAFVFGTISILVYVAVGMLLIDFEPPLAGVMVPSVPFIYFAGAVAFATILVRKVTVENENFQQLTVTQNEDLAEKARRLEKFTYIASHDLKSPVRNITSFAHLVERDLQRNDLDKIPEHLQFIKTSALQMAALIEDILQISTADYGQKTARDRINLNEVALQAKQALLTEFGDREISIECSQLPTYLCNQSEFFLVFRNLIQNGLKYNQSKVPQVEVSTNREAGQLLIHFKDNGIGIEEQYHKQIFDFFTRLHTSDIYEGTGLGLGLCKRIIENYEGTLSVVSSPGEGSTFTIRLPYSGANS